MEWALSVCHARQLGRLAAQPETFRPPGEDGFPDDVDFTRLYFGQEFCERALPRVDEVLQAVRFCHDTGRKFTLITPYVTEDGLARLEDILESLERYGVGGEVVANDWGVLHLLHDRFPSLVPVLGRLLNKIWRDPRMKSYLKDIPPGDRDSFKTCSLAGPFMQDLLGNLGVKRIEMDNLPQGLPGDLPRWGYLVSLYLPYGCIQTGRICFFQSWGLAPEDKFRASPRACPRSCRGQWLEWNGNSGLDGKVLQKGNTVFYRQSAPWVKKSLEEAASFGVGRIVYQAEPL